MKVFKKEVYNSQVSNAFITFSEVEMLSEVEMENMLMFKQIRIKNVNKAIMRSILKCSKLPRVLKI